MSNDEHDAPTVPSLSYAVMRDATKRVASRLVDLVGTGAIADFDTVAEAMALSGRLDALSRGFARWPELGDDEATIARLREPAAAWEAIARALEIAEETNRSEAGRE